MRGLQRQAWRLTCRSRPMLPAAAESPAVSRAQVPSQHQWRRARRPTTIAPASTGLRTATLPINGGASPGAGNRILDSASQSGTTRPSAPTASVVPTIFWVASSRVSVAIVAAERKAFFNAIDRRRRPVGAAAPADVRRAEPATAIAARRRAQGTPYGPPRPTLTGVIAGFR